MACRKGFPTYTGDMAGQDCALQGFALVCLIFAAKVRQTFLSAHEGYSNPPRRLKVRAALEGRGNATSPPGVMLELPLKARLPDWPSGHSNSAEALT